jgi:hypothetical protein
MNDQDPRPCDLTADPDRDRHGGRYYGQTQRALDAGLSAATVESVRQGCYSDAQLATLINDLRRRGGELHLSPTLEEAAMRLIGPEEYDLRFVDPEEYDPTGAGDEEPS